MAFWRRQSNAKDPVCGMTVDEKKAAGNSQYQGKSYYFCSPGCKRSFDRDPQKYLKGGPTPMGGMSTGHH